mgnify:CR=1 FL=1
MTGMFEQPAGNVEKDRSRAVMIVSGLAVLAVIVLIVLVTSVKKNTAPLEFARAGSPEYDGYISAVKFSALDQRTGERLNQRYGRILCTLTNSGDRIISGLQVRMAAIGLSNELLREKVATIIPGNKDTLAPGESINIDISMEPIPDPSEIQDMTLQVYGLRLK